MDKEDDDGFFGPALPPGYEKQDGPKERPVIGPALPPGFKQQDMDDEEYGVKDGVSKVSGPSLPPGFKRTHDDPETVDVGDFVGPALPPDYVSDSSSSAEDDADDEDVIGPMPSKGISQDSVALDFETRARRMKEKLTGVDMGPAVCSRESWMMELPPEMQHVGLSARTFKKRSGSDNKDRSIWTDTPADRERKAREQQEGKKKHGAAKEDRPSFSQKDIETAKTISKYNESKRSESLISMHTKKMKRKAEEEVDKLVERRPFDRDLDLQVNRFDDAQKNALLKKSQELNTRFSHSKDRMFL